MLKHIEYTTVEHQIEKLKKQHLIINDESFAIDALRYYGYSNLIKSYREPYIISGEGRIRYRDGVSFEQIVSLYVLDKNLRNAVMASMLDLEEIVKAAAAEVIASKFGTDQNNYLSFKNYANKRKRKKYFSLDSILDRMKKALDTDRDPVNHCLSHHGNVPPWILFKEVYFSTIVNFIDQFKKSEKIETANLLYDGSALGLSEESLSYLMVDSLSIALEYRNLVAHGGRTYNYSASADLRTELIFNNDSFPSVAGFSMLLFILRLLRYLAPFERLHSVLENEVGRHCSSYPEDATYLGQILNVNISRRDAVYISKRSNKFHLDEHCSGMHNAIQIDRSEAEENGYVPCARCCK